jgi:hypothetical protein
VTLEEPPNSKLFDPTNRQNTDDVNLLASRWLSQVRSTTGQAQAPISVSFPGFAELLLQSRTPATSVPVTTEPGPLATVPASRLLPPMELFIFCDRDHLSHDVRVKLDAIQVTGPHLLSLISDADLRGEGGLSIGELASVRDAQMRWKHHHELASR